MWILMVICCIAFVSISASVKQFHLDPKHCSFSSDRYSVQWAYEPYSKNVVFVLKQQSELENFWTGIGFGNRKKEVIDFIGVFVKNGQIGIADTFIYPDEGTIHPDASTNVQSIVFDYDVINKTVTAKFARSLKSPDIDFDRSLDKCITFNFAHLGGRITRADIRPDLNEFIERRICDIAKYCEVDLHLNVTTDEPVHPPATLEHDQNDHIAPMVIKEALPSDNLEKNGVTGKLKKPEIAASVDISGTGDPCSFSGIGYTVNWTYNPHTELVDFVMKHRVRDGKFWSAVGIGDNMSDMDIAIIFVSYGRPKRIRDYFSNSYGVPTLDKSQDWTLSKLRTRSVNGIIELGFSRKLETNDLYNDRSLDGCVLLQFAANGGHYGNGFEVRKHEEWPDLYKTCDIKTKCIISETKKRYLPETSDNLDEPIEDEGVENLLVMERRIKKLKPFESESKNDNEGDVIQKPKKENDNDKLKKNVNNKNNNTKKTTTMEPRVDETLAADEVLKGKSGRLDETYDSVTTDSIIQNELNGLSMTTAQDQTTEATTMIENITPVTKAKITTFSEGKTVDASVESTTTSKTETTLNFALPLAFKVTTGAVKAEITSSSFEPTNKASMLLTLPSRSFTLSDNASTTDTPPSAEPNAGANRTVELVTFAYPSYTMPMINNELNPFNKSTVESAALPEATTKQVIVVSKATPEFEELVAITVTTEKFTVTTVKAPTSAEPSQDGESSPVISKVSATSESTSLANDLALVKSLTTAEPESQVSEDLTAIESNKTSDENAASKLSLTESFSGITSAINAEAITLQTVLTSHGSKSPKTSEEFLPASTTPFGAVPGNDKNLFDTGIDDVVVPEEIFNHEPITRTHLTATENKTDAATLTAEIDGSGTGSEESEIPASVSDFMHLSSSNAVNNASDVTLSLMPITLDFTTTTTAAASDAGFITNNAKLNFKDEVNRVSESSSQSIAPTLSFSPPLKSTLDNASDEAEVEGSGEFAESPETTIELSTTPQPEPFTGTSEDLRFQLGNTAFGDPKKEGCGVGHEDYSPCGAYFANYLRRVRHWAETNNERYEDQFGKACTLLSRVKHVKTVCCNIFVETCKNKIEF